MSEIAFFLMQGKISSIRMQVSKMLPTGTILQARITAVGQASVDMRVTIITLYVLYSCKLHGKSLS